MSALVALVTLSIICASAQADVSHILHDSTTEPQAGPANPYVFSYQAGRAPGHVDRQHTEVSDGTGVIRGAFSYVDPKNQLRTVKYVADENGFHPELSHKLEDSEAVKRAKEKHFALYNRIAQDHANPLHNQASVAGPQDSEAVVRATNKHLSLFDRIAAEHAAIGAQQEADRQILAANSAHGEVENGQYHPE